MGFSWSPDEGGKLDGHPIHGARGLWRRPGHPSVADYGADHAAFAYRESEDAFDGAVTASGIHWLSSPASIQAAELKLAQLSKAASLGVRFPPTVVTNSSEAAAEFAAQHRSVIVKPVRYGLVASAPEPTVAWTSRVARSELARLSGPPVILQAEIRAVEHLRVVTVGGDVFISRLHTDRLDWRSDIANHAKFSVADPTAFPDVRTSALRLAVSFELGYTSQDWIVDAAEDAWFLDLNPSGQWLFVDDIHSGAITLAIADFLAHHAEVQA